MDGLVEVLRGAGLDAQKPKGSFFLYLPSPSAATAADGQRVVFESAEDASQWLIREKLISTVPWDDAGAFLRFSVTFTAPSLDEEQRVLGEIQQRLDGVSFEF